jgi:hypothetical protein
MSEFSRQAHPDAAHRERLSREIPGLSPRQVQVWFQNRYVHKDPITPHILTAEQTCEAEAFDSRGPRKNDEVKSSARQL